MSHKAVSLHQNINEPLRPEVRQACVAVCLACAVHKGIPGAPNPGNDEFLRRLKLIIDLETDDHNRLNFIHYHRVLTAKKQTGHWKLILGEMPVDFNY